MKKLIFLLAACILATAVPAENWQYWQGQNANGKTKEPAGNIQTADVLWEKNVGMGYSSASVYNNMVLTSGNNGSEDTIYCFKASDGSEIWKYSYFESAGRNYKGTRATPITDGKYVYTFSRSGKVVCLNLKDGSLVWINNLKDKGVKELGWGLSSSIVIYKDSLLIQTGKSGIALDSKTGKLLWGDLTGTSSYSSPVIFKHMGKDYVAFLGEILNIKDAQTGTLIASFEWRAKYNVNAADPLISDDGKNIFLSKGYGGGCTMLAFDGKNLKQLWENKNMSAHFSSPIYHNGLIYGSNGNTGRAKLTALSPKTGDVIWNDPESKFCSIIIANNTLVSIDERGTLSYYDVASENIKKLGSKKFFQGGGKCWTAPVLSDGKIYLRNSNGVFKCIKVK